MEHGTLFVVSAPSGAGKRTILRKIMERDPNLTYGVSVTTRKPRRDETEGEDYYFVALPEFRQRVEAGEFAEWAEVHGNLYGTLRRELSRLLESGKDVFLELDVQGMRRIRGQYPEAVSIFIAAPSFEALEERLRKRGANTEKDLATRLKNARSEMDVRDEYDCIIVNDDVDRAAAEMESIVMARRRGSNETRQGE